MILIYRIDHFVLCSSGTIISASGAIVSEQKELWRLGNAALKKNPEALTKERKIYMSMCVCTCIYVCVYIKTWGEKRFSTLGG